VLIGLIFSLFVSGIAREAAKTIQTHPLCQVPSAEQKQMEESSHKTKRTKKSTTLRDVCLARRRDRKLDKVHPNITQQPGLTDVGWCF
jgi:hypothetical protein